VDWVPNIRRSALRGISGTVGSRTWKQGNIWCGELGKQDIISSWFFPARARRLINICVNLPYFFTQVFPGFQVRELNCHVVSTHYIYVCETPNVYIYIYRSVLTHIIYLYIYIYMYI